MADTQTKHKKVDRGYKVTATETETLPPNNDGDGCGCIGCLIIIAVILGLLVIIKYLWQLLWY